MNLRNAMPNLPLFVSDRASLPDWNTAGKSPPLLTGGAAADHVWQLR
jgi:hypothetical protein